MQKQKFIPPIVLQLIKEYSMPIGTRLDWKTCKRTESRRIKLEMRIRKSPMFLPDDVIGLIREYSKPIGTRLDWRTCKRFESRRIKMSNRALLLWYKWVIGHGESPLYKEIKDWTFYGRRHLILQSRYRIWSQQVVPERPKEGDNEWYEKRYLMQHETPTMISVSTIEWRMNAVSLIV